MTYIFVRKVEKEDKSYLRGFLSNILKTKKLLSLEILSSHPDIHNLEVTDKLSIGIEDIKLFQKKLIYKPFQESSQLGIIHDSQKLTHEAQNSLLKSLEESDDSTIYVLTVDNEKNLLPTIRSRARIIYSHVEKIVESSLQDNFFDLDLVSQFEKIQEASEDRVDSIELINQIENSLKSKFEINIKNGNIDGSKKFLEDLKVIQKSREKINSNCNRRLTLEAMAIQLKE
ncbi:MAG TPA: hypothetical protein PK804_02025 [Candidatus Dojkabacteria bacterium]|jgi:DNA polymerase III delta prime subunit|uniref:DNA polymerase III subunit delta n=1 Tax=Candidatus Dojkabacteria bacterium TaxID=2099670 RepID=A0A847CZQ9_9BACT|nr:hypothetical protein [Candidatus Dojkabacteria bacterium]HNW32905.1 hypothetical protein [Candidatus Dojkabacteria bacterium]HQC39411.1 hypothetical protein [Candidatus Dojkabacteria bacterium]HRZ84930.1 hypothetical protein [Candidatus Dojkabacteria bacterium]